jgi:MFS family permease
MPLDSPTIAERSLSRPRSSVLYYGWIVLACAAVVMAGTLPGRTHGLGLITKPLLTDFRGVNEQSFAHVNLVATLIGSLFCLPCGWLLDRYGSRLMVFVSMVGLGAVVIWLSRTTDFWSLATAITLTRGVGQSMMSVISIAMIGKWFQRNLSPAMGIYAVLMTILMAVSFGIVGQRVETFGWRQAWWELGLVILILALPVSLLTASEPLDRREFLRGGSENKVGATLGQALMTPCFWMFAGSISFFGLVSSGVSLFQQLILEERGFNQGMFRTVVVIGLVAGMFSNLLVGGLARVVRLQFLLAAGLLVLASSLAMLPLIRTEAHAYAYATLYGVAGGFITVMFFTVWGSAFGDRHLGRIQAAAQMLTVLASAVGPEFIAGSRSSQQSSAPVLNCFAVVAALLAALAFFTPVPSFKDE